LASFVLPLRCTFTDLGFYLHCIFILFAFVTLVVPYITFVNITTFIYLVPVAVILYFPLLFVIVVFVVIDITIPLLVVGCFVTILFGLVIQLMPPYY